MIYRECCFFRVFMRCWLIALEKNSLDISERALRIALAKRLYGTDPRTMELIRMCEERETDNNP